LAWSADLYGIETDLQMGKCKNQLSKIVANKLCPTAGLPPAIKIGTIADRKRCSATL
jgi:hypothetical protein